MFASGAIYAARNSLYEPVTIDADHDTMVPLRIMKAGKRVVYQSTAVAWEYGNEEVIREFQRKSRTMLRDARTFLSLKLLLPNLWMTFNLISHKWIRWSVIFPMAVALISNIMLVGEPVYDVLLVLQIVFYAIAVIGYFAHDSVRVPRPLLLPYLLCTVNIAFLFGFARLLMNRNAFIWENRAG